MKNKKIKKMVLVLTLLSLTGALFAAVVTMRTTDRLERFLKNNNLVITYFYKRTAPADRTVENNLQVFRRASTRRRYYDAGVAFATINVARDAAQDIVRMYGLDENNTFVAFKDGRVCGPNYLIGCVGKRDLTSFIEENFSDFIDDALAEQKEERRKERRMRERTSCGCCYSCPVFGPGSPYWDWPGYGYGGYGWPYGGYGGCCGGYGYGCCAPRIGFGVSLCIP